ncbi:fumarylacetoacetate hydrolase family protein [Octadecabacter sp.]|nr:fumarylacetoacetate hydrolase family protein [Octadecabacter sp.]
MTRLVVADPDNNRVIDLAKAGSLAMQAKNATEEASWKMAEVLFPSSLTDAISTGDEFLDRATDVASGHGDDASISMEGIEWAPAADPSIIRDCISFRAHLEAYFEKMGHNLHPLHYKMPAYYKGSTANLVGHNGTVPWPCYTDFVDYELELGFILKSKAHNVTPEQAENMVFGMCILNDFSARDYQDPEMLLMLGPTQSKDFAYAIGPWITTMDEIKDMSSMEMKAFVNDELWSHGKADTMRWTPKDLIAYISRGDTVLPGDLLGSGTVGGGSALELDRKPVPGDVVRMEVTGLGSLSVTMGQKETMHWGPTKEELDPKNNA